MSKNMKSGMDMAKGEAKSSPASGGLAGEYNKAGKADGRDATSWSGSGTMGSKHPCN